MSTNTYNTFYYLQLYFLELKYEHCYIRSYVRIPAGYNGILMRHTVYVTGPANQSYDHIKFDEFKIR